MKGRDIVIGIVVIVLLVALVLWVRKMRIEKGQDLVVETPTVEEKVSQTFNGFTIPADVEKVELSDTTGGNSFGVATPDMVLADLPDPEAGYFYQVWVEKDGNLTSKGKMRIAKGGYLFEGNMSDKVVVSLERVFDNDLETKVLEGSF